MTLSSNSKFVLRIQFVVALGLTMGAVMSGIGIAGEYFAVSTGMQITGIELTVMYTAITNETTKELLLESLHELKETAIDSQKKHEIIKWLGFSLVVGTIIFGFKSISKLD